MKHVAVIGCGVVGATIAYELSRVPGLSVTVFDRHSPAQASTGAALGILMGIISQKTRGRSWAMRQTSIRRYETLIPELEAATGHSIPWNRQGIVLLYFEEAERSRWEKLAETRRPEGWMLNLWTTQQVYLRCPQLQADRIVGAVYSPSDRQIDPTALTLALVAASEQNGVDFRFDTEVKGFLDPVDFASTAGDRTCEGVQTTTEALSADWVVVAAGIGTTLLTQTVDRPVNIRPVLGQAMRVRVDRVLGDPHFQPVITGEDIHIVPLGNGEYWVGATVEFPTGTDDEIVANADLLQEVWQGAVALCPELNHAKVLQTWSGLRPRPSDRPAPVIEPLAGYRNILLATGHYRNGILLAPATALAVREAILRTEHD